MVIGNCGFGFAPCAANDKDRDRLMLALTRNESIPYESMKLGMLWDWVTFPEFLDSLARIPKAVNVITYVPLTPLYAWVMGYDEAKRRRPTGAELEQMCGLMHEAMDAGACGWSAQVLGPDSVQRDYDGTPMITDLIPEEELLTFARVLADRDEGSIELSFQSPGESGRTMIAESTMRLYENVAQMANRPVLYQIVAPNDDNPDTHRHRLRWLEECTRRGVRVYGQALSFRSGLELTFEDWNLFDESPAWREVTLGTPAERKEKMQNPKLRAALRAEWDTGIRPDQVVAGSAAALVVEDVGRRDFEEYIGQSVDQIARAKGKHVIDALLDIVVEDNLQTEFFSPVGQGVPRYTAEVINSPYTLGGLSDGGAHVKFNPSGHTTDLLGWVVRDEGVVSLEQAHFHLSYMPAVLGGFRNTGYLGEGAAADIIVYDLENLAPGPVEIAHDLPGGDWRRVRKAEGYRWTLVNGQVTLEDGAPTGPMPGKLLRHGAA